MASRCEKEGTTTDSWFTYSYNPTEWHRWIILYCTDVPTSVYWQINTTILNHTEHPDWTIFRSYLRVRVKESGVFANRGYLWIIASSSKTPNQNLLWYDLWFVSYCICLRASVFLDGRLAPPSRDIETSLVCQLPYRAQSALSLALPVRKDIHCPSSQPSGSKN